LLSNGDVVPAIFAKVTQPEKIRLIDRLGIIRWFLLKNLPSQAPALFALPKALLNVNMFIRTYLLSPPVNRALSLSRRHSLGKKDFSPVEVNPRCL
jgi:hypothetical protein